MSFPRYEKYKASGVEWLGEVPEHWDVSAFKWHIDRNDGGVWGDEPDGEDDTYVLRSTEQTFDGRWVIDDPAQRKLNRADKTFALLEDGDLLVTKSSGSSLHIGKTTIVSTEIANLRCCFSNFMQRLRMKPSWLPRLAWYVINSDLVRLQLNFLSNSTTGLANLNGGMLGQIVLPVPPQSEQVALLAFLDIETPKIDELVEEQRRLIELLKEKRQAVISHAVTKGLSPHAPMKDSGIEWLGQVPEHWEVKRLKQLIEEGSSISYGIVQPGEPQDEGVPFIQTTNMSSGAFDFDSLQKTTVDIANAYPRSRLYGGEVILGIRASIGAVYVVPEHLCGVNLSRGVARIACNTQISPTYLVWALRSGSTFNYWQLSKQGSTFNEVSIDTVREITLAIPPVAEQSAINAFINRETGRLDVLTAEAGGAITLLQERRTALISAAVTGKIDVRMLSNHSGGASENLTKQHLKTEVLAAAG